VSEQATLHEQLRASLEPLIEILAKAAPAAAPAPAREPDDDSEAEFRARLEAEMEDEFRERLLTEKKQVATAASRFTKNIEQWKADVRHEIDEIKSRPVTVIQAAPIQVVEPKPESKPPSALDWTLEVTGRDNGLIRTVVGTAEGREVQFTIRRTPDGFPKAIDVRMAA